MLNSSCENALLTITSISKKFHANSMHEILVLNNINFCVHEEEQVYIVGANGCGKSTLLRIIAQELSPDKGEVIFSGCSYKEIAFIEQNVNANIVSDMTIYENLLASGILAYATPWNFSNCYNKQYEKIFFDILSPFGLGLEKRLHDKVSLLSGGQQQVIVAAQILLRKPKVILLDEFTSALDKKTGPLILTALEKLKNENKSAIIAVTHDFHLIESHHQNARVIVMANGTIKDDFSERHDGKQITADFIFKDIYDN